MPGKAVAQKEDAGSDKDAPKISPKENKAEPGKTIPKEDKAKPEKTAPKKDKAATGKEALKEDKTAPDKVTSKENKADPKKEKKTSGKTAPQKEAAKKNSSEKKAEKVPPAGKIEKPVKAPEPPKAAPGTGGPAAQAKPSVQPGPTQPKEAPRRSDEQIVYLKLSELHAFKNHPFQVRNDEEMKAMVSSVKDKGVTQPAIVRPREDGGYEIVSGHRRQKASELAGYADMPCIIRNLTDEQAITQMVEDNTNQRENILPSERAKALKMQLEAIKHQGAKNFTSGQLDPKDAGRRSNEVVAERNKMTVKQVQRYIKLNDLVPDLQKMMDEGRIKFTPAVELAYIKPRNQNYIAVAIDSQQSSPSLSQAQRMRELDQKGVLNGDVIDGIMIEDKKEVDKVILTGAELGKYFGKETTPREMKDQIIKLLDDWKDQQKNIAKPEKKAAQPEK
ncbi:MAG: ParB/RepB/Spo0J family partition protein [Enterocloster citroniae]|nr:ParB/RepB/Spo0J family partition protein [Enterocloster citroniae]